MARKKGEKYPSDHRRWFRLDSEELAARTADLTDAEFRSFILILAWANEHKAQERDDTIIIARSQLLSVSPNSRESVASAARVVRQLAAKQTWPIREEGARWVIKIEKYSQKQGFAPTEPRRDPDETPTTTTTTTTTPITPPTEEAKRPSSDARESSDWVAPMLTHQAKSTDAERDLWLEAHWPEIVATAEIECPEDELLSKHLKRYAIRKWNTYVKTRDPSQRQFYREVSFRRKSASLQALDAQLAAEPRASPEPELELDLDDDPLRMLKAGANPYAS